ncbi:hypothetical protein G9A89_017410 [Geosiphon pyriformis]|nr:hypothetical protein G9A89_017410 [Geosiphon pyriformis]
MGFSLSAAPLNKDGLMVSSNLKGKMAAKDLFLVTIADRILLVSVVWGGLDSELLVVASFGVLDFLMLFEWSFGVVFELVVGTDKLFGAVADKLPVAAVDKLEVDILVVDRLVAASLASNWLDIGFGLGSNSESEICNQGFNIDFPIVNCCYKTNSWL